MWDLPGEPLLDKRTLLGGCVRLPVAIDAARLRAEVDAFAEGWRDAGGRGSVHRNARAIFLRGHAPAEGPLAIEDRPALAALPYARSLIEGGIAPRAQRALLARIAPGEIVAVHRDRAPYFDKTLRVHVPVETHERAWMYCDGLAYRMRCGEAWLLDNCAPHGVWNGDDEQSRTHLIVDFLPSEALLQRIAVGERGLGVIDADVLAALGFESEQRVAG